MAPDDDDPKVKAIIDAQTEEDLARWFGLPSFQQLAEMPPPAPGGEIDEEMRAVIERRDRALAAVDPALLEAIRVRTEAQSETLLKFEAVLDVVVDENISNVDETLIDRAMAIAEPREVEISDELRDDMKDCTPQALLRDLHRPEFDFDKQFELVDVSAEQRLDIVAEVATAMATSWKLPPLAVSPVLENRVLLAELRAQRRRPWTELVPELSNRRVRE